MSRAGVAVYAARAHRPLTPNDINVIRERRFGWEKASPSLLAAVFGVSVQKINAICEGDA